jgi:hypothetical protein
MGGKSHRERNKKGGDNFNMPSNNVQPNYNLPQQGSNLIGAATITQPEAIIQPPIISSTVLPAQIGKTDIQNDNLEQQGVSPSSVIQQQDNSNNNFNR